MKKINLSKSIFPNFATSLNVLSGFLSIVYASQNNFHLAAVFIFIAAFFDLIDGLIARLTKTSSQFGVELDSLADVVSFGAAPSFLLYKTYFLDFGIWGIIISSSLLIFGAFRLARFNVQLEDISKKLDFTGLPIPVQAITIASIVLFFFNGVSFAKIFESLLIPIVILLSFLMVSNIRYNALPKLKYLSMFYRIIVIVASLLALIGIYFTDGVAIFYYLSLNILWGIIRHLFNLFINLNNSPAN